MKYINVTILIPAANHYEQDLRLPLQLTVNQLIALLIDDLAQRAIYLNTTLLNVIKVQTKSLLLVSTDLLADFPLADGDILQIF